MFIFYPTGAHNTRVSWKKVLLKSLNVCMEILFLENQDLILGRGKRISSFPQGPRLALGPHTDS